MSFSIIARRHAAKILVSLAKEEPPTADVQAMAVSGRVEVVVIIRPTRYSLPTPMEANITDIRARGFEVAPLSSPTPVPTVELTEPEQRVLAALSSTPATARAIARKAGYSPKTGKIRVILPALVRKGLAAHSQGGGYKLA